MEHCYQEKSVNNLSVNKNSDTPIVYRAGSVIFNAGQLTKFLYLVKKGEIRLVKSSGHHLNVLKICREKEILNEVSIITSKPTGYAAIAKSDVELILIDQKDILEVMTSGPEWIPDMFKTLCERLKATQEIIEEHQLLSGELNKDLILSKDEELALMSVLKSQLV